MAQTGLQCVQEFMCLDANVTLVATDGELQANATILRMHSRVLRHALDVTSAGVAAGVVMQNNARSSRSSSGGARLPLPDISKSDWLSVAPFLYPVVPRPSIQDWSQLETLLKVGSVLDMPVLLHEVDAYMLVHAKELVADTSSPHSVWRWLQLVDRAGLAASYDAVVKQAVRLDRGGCARDELLQDLSRQGLHQLIRSLTASPLPRAIFS